MKANEVKHHFIINAQGRDAIVLFDPYIHPDGSIQLMGVTTKGINGEMVIFSKIVSPNEEIEVVRESGTVPIGYAGAEEPSTISVENPEPVIEVDKAA